MKEMILAAMMAAGASGSTYELMQRPSPTPELSAQVAQLNATVAQLLAAHERSQQMQAAAFQTQAEATNRLLILGRLQVRAITGADPLPILQQADAARAIRP